MSWFDSNVSMLLGGLRNRGLLAKALELGGLDAVYAAVEAEAEWLGELEEFGSSDMNYSLRNIFRDLGEPDLFGWDAEAA